MENKRPNLALVLSGGGARGAYEAGVLHYIRTMLPLQLGSRRRFDVLCGSSVGAINTCFIAATSHDLSYQGKYIYEIWKTIRQQDIYRRGAGSLISLISKSFAGITRNLFTKLSKKKIKPDDAVFKNHFRGLLDTAPLTPYLKEHIPWRQISLNIQNELIKAVSLTATNVNTGKLELFIEKHPSVPYTGHYIYHETKLEPWHAIASAAIPCIFPTVRINRSHYLDGGLRLNTPMSPAIQLGAEKMLVIGMHHSSEKVESSKSELFVEADSSPSLGAIIGNVLTSIFLDKLDYDIEQMNRINRVIEWSEGCFGSDYISKVNQYLLDNQIKGDIANRGLKKLQVMKIFPSRDVRNIFFESIGDKQLFLDDLTNTERFILKILDVDLGSSKEFLSFIMFHPQYLSKLLDLGFEDARAKHDELLDFFS